MHTSLLVICVLGGPRTLTEIRKLKPYDWSRLKFFGSDEFSEPDKMDLKFLLDLDYARQLAGVPFEITSSYREDSPAHMSGKAVDIACASSRVRFIIVKSLLLAGFTRIGVYDRHVHVSGDVDGHDRVLWLGLSR